MEPQAYWPGLVRTNRRQDGVRMAWIKEDRLYPLIVLLLIWVMAARLPLDSDMWWHLRAGQETVTNRAVYRVDDFSYTRAGTEWINHSWLSQVVMHGIFRVAGFPGLSILVAACAVVSLYLVYLQMIGHPLLRGAVLLMAGATASVVWSPRPQIFSLIMLALIAWIVSKYRQSGNWWVLLSLPPLFALWGNLHGGYVLGLIYLGSYLAGDVLDQVLDSQGPKRRIPSSIYALVGFAVLSGLAVLINPFGLDMWRIPFNTIGVDTLQNLISEWASPDFHQAFQQPFLWMMLGIMAVFALSSNKVAGKDLVPVLAFTYAALTARRNFGPFAIVASPVLASQLSLLVQDKKGFLGYLARAAERSKREFNPAVRNIVNVALIGLLVFAAGYKTFQVNQEALMLEYEAEMFPLSASSWMKENGITGNLFTDYNWGGYLIYRLPECRVFVDGRTDLYGDEILNDYLTIMGGDNGWEDLLGRYQVDYLLLQQGSDLAIIAADHGWSILYEDPRAVLLKFPDSE